MITCNDSGSYIPNTWNVKMHFKIVTFSFFDNLEDLLRFKYKLKNENKAFHQE